MNEELNMENMEKLEDTVDVEMTEAELGAPADGMEAVADDDLENVAGGAGVVAGTKLYVVIKACNGYNTASVLGRKPIAYLKRGLYLRNCRLVKVLGSNVDWVNYFAFGTSRNGPWTNQVGWTEVSNCNLLAY